MTAPERFAEKSDSLLQRGRRPYMTHERHWLQDLGATQQERRRLIGRLERADQCYI